MNDPQRIILDDVRLALAKVRDAERNIDEQLVRALGALCRHAGDPDALPELARMHGRLMADAFRGNRQTEPDEYIDRLNALACRATEQFAEVHALITEIVDLYEEGATCATCAGKLLSPPLQ